jgi:hypothetical protein
MRVRVLQGQQAIEAIPIGSPGCDFAGECHPRTDIAAAQYHESV